METRGLPRVKEGGSRGRTNAGLAASMHSIRLRSAASSHRAGHCGELTSMVSAGNGSRETERETEDRPWGVYCEQRTDRHVGE